MKEHLFRKSVDQVAEFHPSAFEKEFSRFVALTRERVPLPDAPRLVRPTKPWQRMTRREQEQAKRDFRARRYFEDAIAARELHVVDFFLRKTERERPDSTKLAWRCHELDERGWLSRGRWTLKRYASKRGAHWVVVPRP